MTHMFPRTRFLPLCLFSLLCLGHSLSLAAQPPSAPSGLDQLRALPEHTRLLVVTDKGKNRCALMHVTEDTIACENASYLRPSIRSVKLVRHGASTVHGLLVGLGIGVGGGAIVGAALGNSAFDTPGRGAAVGMAIFAPVGAAIGAGVGRAADHATRTIYQP